MNNFIEDLKKNKSLKHITISNDAALSDNSLNIENLPFFKIPAKYYQNFDVVWHDQNAFGTQLNWRVILDEMIRLIGKEGRLVIAIDSDSKAHKV